MTVRAAKKPLAFYLIYFPQRAKFANYVAGDSDEDLLAATLRIVNYPVILVQSISLASKKSI